MWKTPSNSLENVFHTASSVEYIFPRLDKVCPWEGTEMKTDFFFREKVFLSEIVGKKDRLSNRAEQLSNRAERLSTRAKRG